MNPIILTKIVEMFVNKKRVIGWISAVGIAIGAATAGMQSQEFKDAVCSAPVIAPIEK
jgi:hypothetical protein